MIHTGKTGGSAIKRALRTSGYAYWHEPDAAGTTPTPYGPVQLHNHRFPLSQVPPDHYAFFFMRDPIKRFISGFYSRLDQGRPRYDFPWSENERKAFEAFPTPQSLAAALAGDDPEQRALAEWSMGQIGHLGFQRRRLGPPAKIRERLDQIVYIGRQETLDDDWEKLKSILEIRADVELPTDPVLAHRRVDDDRDKTLDKAAKRALREWYARDYKLLKFCEEVRLERGWAKPPAPRPKKAPSPPKSLPARLRAKLRA
jgi:hypothetical protein